MSADVRPGYRAIDRSKRIRVLISILLSLAGGFAIIKGGYLAFVPVGFHGGFVGEEMFYAGALQFMASGMLALALLAWFLALLLLRPVLPARAISNALTAMIGGTVIACPYLVLFLRNRNLIALEIFALLWVLLLPFLWVSANWLSGRSRRP